MTPAEWCSQKIWLSERFSEKPGYMQFEGRCPYFREVVDTIADEEINHITLVKPAQIGGTTCIMGMASYIVANDPRPTIFVNANEQDAKSLSKNRLQQIFDDCEEVRNEKTDNPHDYSLLEMKFRRMTLTLVGANSPPRLKGRPASILFRDEVDTYPGETEDETGAMEGSASGAKVEEGP